MLTFANHFPQDVWVAYMFYAPDACGGEGGDWQTIGWFHVTSGQSTVVYANSLGDVHNRYWYFYAETPDRSAVWAGPVEVYVTQEAFNHCIDVGTTESRIVGYRIFDVGDANDFTVNLVP